MTMYGIPVQEAVERAEVRITRMDAVGVVGAPGAPEVADPRMGCAATCVDSDVDAGELLRFLVASTGQFQELIESRADLVCDCPGAEVGNHLNCWARPAIAGMFLRVWWAGYEAGKAERP